MVETIHPSLPLLALDLASRRVGVCWYAGPDEYQAASVTLVGGNVNQRLHDLIAWLHEHLADWRETGMAPALLVIETPDLMRRGMTTTPAVLRALYKAAGIVMAVCAAHDLEMREVDPRLVRERIAGWETAGKRDVQICLDRRGYEMARLPNGQIDHDAMDALALAVMVADEIEQAAKQGGAGVPR